MPFHEYSRLFTSGLLSDPSPSPTAGGTLFLEPADPESPKPADARTWSFLELADSMVSPVTPADQSSSCHSLGRRAASVAASPTTARHLAPLRVRRSVKSTSLSPSIPSPADSLSPLSIISFPAGQSFLITELPLPDSPTLTRRPSGRTVMSGSTSSASISVKSETKRMNRLEALACLEGRESSSTRVPRKSHSNFMSMSDDEDEDDIFTSTDWEANRRLSTVMTGNIPLPAIMLGVEKEAGSFPSDFLVTQSPRQSRVAPVRNRHRSRTLESWFPPLANFIDLKNEEDPPKWRSFIEFSTTAV